MSFKALNREVGIPSLKLEFSFMNSSDVERAATVDEKRNSGDEVGLLGGEKQRGIGHVPSRTHFAPQRYAGIALRRDLGAALAAHAGARVDRHRRIDQAGQDHVSANAELGILN